MFSSDLSRTHNTRLQVGPCITSTNKLTQVFIKFKLFLIKLLPSQQFLGFLQYREKKLLDVLNTGEHFYPPHIFLN